MTRPQITKSSKGMLGKVAMPKIGKKKPEKEAVPEATPFPSLKEYFGKEKAEKPANDEASDAPSNDYQKDTLPSKTITSKQNPKLDYNREPSKEKALSKEEEKNIDGIA